MTEPRYQFYVIKSQKSVPDAQGNRQETLACVDEPLIKAFFWLNQAEEPTHVQFFFNEEIIEWRSGQSTLYGKTNRFNQSGGEQGRQKGSRTFVTNEDNSTLAQGRRIFEDSAVPEPYLSWMARLWEWAPLCETEKFCAY